MRRIKLDNNVIPVWILVALMVGAGSLAIAVQGADDQNKFEISDTTKPRSDSLVFTGLPVVFDAEDDLTLDCVNQPDPSEQCVSEGTKMVNAQEILLNFKADVGEEVRVTIPLVNHSEDEQIIMLKAESPEQLVLDIEEGTGTEGVRLVEQNTWRMNVFVTDVDCPDGFDCPLDFDLMVSAEHSGSFTVKLQILTVG
jgi:hypothetical protein